jgi:hypothetical protein
MNAILLECHFMQAFKRKGIKMSKPKIEIFDNQVKIIGLFKKKDIIIEEILF